MPNGFNKQETVLFDQAIEGFQDALVLSKNVSIFETDQQTMERSADIIWRPQPYVAQSFAGTDMTSNFRDQFQLAVPATIGFARSSPWILTARELRDGQQEKRLTDAAQQKLASDINLAILNVATVQGSLVVRRTTSPTGFDDIALADAIMNEQGIQYTDRCIALNTRDYNSMAGNLAARQTMNEKPVTAYDRAKISDNIANFATFKLDYSQRLLAATGVGVTITTANQFYTPRATSTAATGEVGNVDNRFQTIPITVTSGLVRVGDAFTIAGVFATHQITKQDTGQLKTFRVNAIVTGGGGTGTVQITPPIISAQGATDAERQYQNVTTTPAAGAAVTFLNTFTNNVNVFWHKDALEILPGRYVIPDNSGVATMRATTDQGIEVVMQKFADINTMQTKYRLDVLYGVVNKQTQMSGIMLFNQV